jgi:hypothetical protein
MSTKSTSKSSASGGDDGMDTSYPSVPTDCLSVEWSSNGTVVSLQYERLVVIIKQQLQHIWLYLGLAVPLLTESNSSGRC